MLHVTVTVSPVVPIKQIREKITKYVQKSGENKAMNIRVVNNMKMKKMIFFNIPVIGSLTQKSKSACLAAVGADCLFMKHLLFDGEYSKDPHSGWAVQRFPQSTVDPAV